MGSEPLTKRHCRRSNVMPCALQVRSTGSARQTVILMSTTHVLRHSRCGTVAVDRMLSE